MCLLQSGYYLSVKNHTLSFIFTTQRSKLNRNCVMRVKGIDRTCRMNRSAKDRPNILKKMLKLLIISNHFKLLCNKQTFFLIFNEKPQSGKYITTSLHNFSFKIYQSTLLPAPSPPSILYFEKYAMVYFYKGIINSV